MTAAATTAGRPVLTDELLATFASRSFTYDRENEFCADDFNDLRRAGYLRLAVPSELGRSRGYRSFRARCVRVGAARFWEHLLRSGAPCVRRDAPVDQIEALDRAVALDGPRVGSGSSGAAATSRSSVMRASDGSIPPTRC